jgi:hypothetical protein
MSAFAERYVEPSERAAAAADPDYEHRNGIAEFVICRVPRCGFKCSHGLRVHLQQADKLSVKNYSRMYSGAPTSAKKFRDQEGTARKAREVKRDQQKAEFERALIAASTPRKPSGRPQQREEHKRYVEIGRRVEALIPDNEKQQRRSIIAARQEVASQTRLEYDAVATYHKGYRRFLRGAGA